MQIDSTQAMSINAALALAYAAEGAAKSLAVLLNAGHEGRDAANAMHRLTVQLAEASGKHLSDHAAEKPTA